MSRPRKRFLIAVLPLGLAGCFGSPGSDDTSDGVGLTLFVDRSNNTGRADGSAQFPYVSIQDALDQLLGGEVVQVGPGVYEETLSVKSDVQLVGSGAELTTLDGDGANPLFTLGSKVTSISVQGFTLQDGYSSSGAVVDGDGVALRFEDCLLRSNSTGASGGNSEAFNAAVIRSRNQGSLWLSRCVFLDSASNAVAVVEPTSATIRNCVMGMVDGSGIVVRGNQLSTDPDVLIENVTVSGNSEPGIFVAAFGDAVLRNCILSGQSNGIFESQFAGDPQLFYNDVRNGYKDIDTDTTYLDPADIDALTPPGVNVGTLNVDPAFVDAAAGDYRLSPGSPCVDAGDPALSDGDGSRSDLGAYGGPGGELSFGVGLALAPGFPLRSTHHGSLQRLLDTDPGAAAPGRDHWTDLDGDGRLDRLRIDEGGGLSWWVDRRGRGERPAPIPPGLHTIRRATTYDVNGDGSLDLVVEDELGHRDVHCRIASGPAPIAVRSLPGDQVVVRGPISVRRRTGHARGDRADGALLFAAAPGASYRIRVLRDGIPVLEAQARAGDELVVPGAGSAGGDS